MRSVVVTAVLLVVLMSMSASAAFDPGEICPTKYPATACPIISGGGWYQTSKNVAGGNRCVKAFTSPYLTHSDAEVFCRRYYGGNLVSMHSLDDINQVTCATFRAAPANIQYWIGLVQGSRGFAWTDRTKFDYYNWAIGEPNDWRNDRCVETNFRGWGRWNDANCNFRRPYVCQVSIE